MNTESTHDYITVKNTFLDIKRSSPDNAVRRSSSVPRAFKPGEMDRFDMEDSFSGQKDQDFYSARSDDSDTASDFDELDHMPTISCDDSDSQDSIAHEDPTDLEELANVDYPDNCSDCTDEDLDFNDMYWSYNYQASMTRTSTSMNQTTCGACWESSPTASDSTWEGPLSFSPQVSESTCRNPQAVACSFGDMVSQVSLSSNPYYPDMVGENDVTPKMSLSDMVGHQAEEHKAMPSKTTLSLDDMVEEGAEKARIKLRPTARPFKSVREPTADTNFVIACAKEVISTFGDIIDVQVRDGGMGGTTVIIAKSRSADPDPSLIFSLVQDALLNSAAQSENTYIMGYGSEPFKKLDTLSFTATLAVPAVAHHKTTCWDTYEKGYCPRCATCRWNHPTEIDKMRVIVMIQNMVSQ